MSTTGRKIPRVVDAGDSAENNDAVSDGLVQATGPE